MPYCSGCSQSVKFMEGTRCDPCSEAPSNSKPRDEWSHCVDCGRRFEFLVGSQCGRCKDREDSSTMPPPKSAPSVPDAEPASVSETLNRDIHHAMSTPANPRTHGTSQAPPFFNPYQHSQRQVDENDPRYHNAQALFKDFQNGFSDAIHRASPQMKIAKPKLRGAEPGPTTRPVPKIHVVVRKIINRNQKNLSTPFDPQLISYEETRLWVTIEDNILTWLDGVYSKEHGHRICSKDDFSLEYSFRKVALHATSRDEGATLKDLWKASINQPGLLVQPKHISSLTLELNAKVKYPLKKDMDEDDSDYGFKSNTKRTAEDYPTGSLIQPYKRFNAEPSGARPYATNIVSIARPKPNSDQESFVVKMLTVSLSGTPPDSEAVWKETEETLSIIIDKTKFSSGKTKNAYKLRCLQFGATYFAAKSYYDIGSYSAPKVEENTEHLEQELIRQLIIKDAISDFLNVTRKNNIAVHDLQVADAFMLKVCEGPNEGQSWLVDRLLDNSKMRKFSGTDNAGASSDFAGRTCDAFAHFTLFTSGLEFVPVDIQGIDTPVFRGNIPAANTITLIDLMAHSKLGSMGLGDNGLEGMKLFCEQHKCNGICKKLKLPPTSELISLINTMETDDTVYDNPLDPLAYFDYNRDDEQSIGKARTDVNEDDGTEVTEGSEEEFSGAESQDNE